MSEDTEIKVDDWGDAQTLERLKGVLPSLTSMPWSLRKDPTRDSYYIAGPPDTSIIMEGLTYENASTILDIVRSLPEVVDSFERLSRTVKAVLHPKPNSLLHIVNAYQMKLAQLAGSPTPIPSASRAEELSFMHIGQTITLPGGEELPITNVEQKPGVTVVHLGDERVIAYLPPEMEVAVNIRTPWATPAEIDVPEDDPTLPVPEPPLLDASKLPTEELGIQPPPTDET